MEHLGYEYVYAPDIAPDTLKSERATYEEVLLLGRLEEAIRRINPRIPYDTQTEAIKEAQRINSQNYS